MDLRGRPVQREYATISHDPDQQRFADYISQFDDLFARVDQREWFRLYVRGLLIAPERKNVEAIAAALTRFKSGVNLGQALQHFVTDSPWEHKEVLVRYRESLLAAVREGAATWVVHDGVLLKKGRNSVGTQRQLARSIGRKVNCQVAVVVGVAGDFGYAPLAVRLYLPSYWLREFPDLAARTVPEGWRAPTPKGAIALSLLDELREEGWNAPAAAVDEGYATADGFAEALAERGVRLTESTADPLAAAGERFEWLKGRLGLDHFEGRTWAGWHHHAAMVFAAAGYLATEPEPWG